MSEDDWRNELNCYWQLRGTSHGIPMPKYSYTMVGPAAFTGRVEYDGVQYAPRMRFSSKAEGKRVMDRWLYERFVLCQEEPNLASFAAGTQPPVPQQQHRPLTCQTASNPETERFLRNAMEQIRSSQTPSDPPRMHPALQSPPRPRPRPIAPVPYDDDRACPRHEKFVAYMDMGYQHEGMPTETALRLVLQQMPQFVYLLHSLATPSSQWTEERIAAMRRTYPDILPPDRIKLVTVPCPDPEHSSLAISHWISANIGARVHAFATRIDTIMNSGAVGPSTRLTTTTYTDINGKHVSTSTVVDDIEEELRARALHLKVVTTAQFGAVLRAMYSDHASAVGRCVTVECFEWPRGS